MMAIVAKADALDKDAVAKVFNGKRRCWEEVGGVSQCSGWMPGWSFFMRSTHICWGCYLMYDKCMSLNAACVKRRWE